MRFLITENRINDYGFVIMSKHLHLIWRIKTPHLLKNVQRDFLKYTAQQIKFDLQANDPDLLSRFKVNAADRDYQFWERNALSVDLFSEHVFMQKFEYIHNNPTQEKWKLVLYPEDYRWSSANYYYRGVDNFGFISHIRGDE